MEIAANHDDRVEADRDTKIMTTLSDDRDG